MVTTTPKTRTIQNNTPNDALPVDTSFQELYANDATLATAVTALETTQVPISALIGLNNTTAPVYQTVTTFSVARLACLSDTNTRFMTKNTSTTVDLSAAGVNGVAQSSNLTGTISVTNAGTTVTGAGTSFLSNFIVGDVIRTNGGNGRRITAIASNTSMTVATAWAATENAVAYRRGGRAPDTFYHLYAIDNGTTANLMLSTRSEATGQTLIDLPAGYTFKRQLAFTARTDSTNNWLPFTVGSGWPSRPEILYSLGNTSNLAYRAFLHQLSEGGSTTYPLDALIPATARVARLAFTYNPQASVFNQAFYTGQGGTRTLGVPQNTAGIQHVYQDNVPLATSRQLIVETNSASVVTGYALGYTITEVN
jgi:hypothetical protein